LISHERLKTTRRLIAKHVDWPREADSPKEAESHEEADSHVR